MIIFVRIFNWKSEINFTFYIVRIAYKSRLRIYVNYNLPYRIYTYKYIYV